MSQLHPCPDCDFVGPDASGLASDLREPHRAFADMGWAIAHAIRLIDLAYTFRRVVR